MFIFFTYVAIIINIVIISIVSDTYAYIHAQVDDVI